METAVGIDLGGSHVTAVVVDITGKVFARAGAAVGAHDFDTVFGIMNDCLHQVLETNGEARALGLGIPGNVNPAQGMTRYLPSFPWGKLDIARHFAAYNLPLTMRNDGRCAAIAESQLGSGRNSKVFALLTLGTGIGGALILNGELFDGASFDAGDFGHHVIRAGADGFPCVCGKRGCFEMHASAQGLVRHVHNAGGTAENAVQVMEQYRGGDRNARTAFANFLEDLSIGLANLITFYNPDTIAIGGGLSHAPEIFENIDALVDEKCLPASRQFVKIMPATLGADAGAIGAGLLALHSLSPAIANP